MTKAINMNGFWKLVVASFMALALVTSLFIMPVHAAEVVDDESTEANVEFIPGQLTLVQAPHLNFGDQNTIPSVTTDYVSTDADITPIRVSDLRGSNDGWKVNVALSKFRTAGGTAESGPYTLDGAYITVTDPIVEAVNNTVGTEPTATKPLKITSDNVEAKVVEAAATTGGGIWQEVWTPGKTKLTVLPGTVQAGASVADLAWTLVNAP